MSTTTYVDSESITQADEAQSSPMHVPLPDDPYVVVKQARLVDTESEPEEAPSEAEELQSLGFRVPLMGEEFEAVESSGTRTNSFHSSALSDSTTPLSPDHPLTHISPNPTPTHASFHSRTTPFCKSEGDELGDEDIEEDEKDESLDAYDKGERSDDKGHGSDDEGRGLSDEKHRLDEKGHGLEGEGLGLEEEEAALEGQQQRHALESIEEIAPSTYEVDPEDDRVYTDIPVYPPVAPVQTSLSPKWSSGSLPVSLSSPIVPSPIASPVATPTATISVGEDQFIERYRFRSLEREQERTAVMFGALWRLVLALEAWAGHVDTLMEDMSWAGYDDHRMIHDMLVQQTAM
ncbi:hypothetical protein Tco_1450589 [Tanacetum coccineum]